VKRLLGIDRVFLGYVAALSLLVLLTLPEGWPLFLGGHLLAVAAVAGLIALHARNGGDLATFLRHWYPVAAISLAFRELHYLVPRIRPFDDHRYDHQLAAIDADWFGDVDAFFLSLAHPGWIDLLHLCYWSYFGLMIVPGALLYVRGELPRMRHYATVLLTGLFLSYLAYFIFPSVGPHHFFPERPPALDGWGVGAILHPLLMRLELRMPDAFPSGHALATTVTLVMAWKLHRPSYRWLLAPGVGIVIATVALRYHYVVDVLAGLALVPVVVFLGTAVHRRAEAASPPATGATTSSAS
jgi:membrane-associated phospholipid phosphatase